MTSTFQERIDVPLGTDRLAGILTTARGAKQRRLAILVHGGPGGVKDGPDRLYVELAQRLAESGVSSIRFDFRGAGESTGRYRDMTIARQAVELTTVYKFALREFSPRSIGVVGESFGGTIALRALASTVDALVLLYPAIYLLEEAFAPLVTENNLAMARRIGFVEGETKIGLAFLEEVLTTKDVSSSLVELKTPTLFVHGDADTEVPVDQSRRGMELLAGKKKLVIVPGGEHCLRRPDEREIVYTEVTEWLGKYL